MNAALGAAVFAAIAGRAQRMPAAAPLACRADPPALARGRIDAQALRSRFSDPVLHARLAPSPAAARGLFDQMEQARVEALGLRRWRGMRINLAALQAAPAAAPLSARAGALLGQLRQILDLPVSPSPALDAHPLPLPAALASLVAVVDDQAGFGRLAQQFLAAAALGADEAPVPVSQRASGPTDTPESVPPPAGPMAAWREGPGELLRRVANEPRGRLVPLTRQVPVAPAYRVYTRQFDTVERARALCTAPELAALRHQLDDFSQQAAARHGPSARRLQRQLMATQQRHAARSADDGRLDPACLAGLVANPLRAPAYRQEMLARAPGTVVTLLIDNSGSLRGAPIATAAACVELLAATLERCGVRTEIAGFTTRGWRGGRAAAAWATAGRPSRPGRIAALRHVLYKTPDQPWRATRQSVAALLHAPLLCENVDGEALVWAYGRLLRRPEPRRILLVVSDGAPLEEATLAANDPGYLERHLQGVTQHIERQAAVDLLAIGIGHDVSRYYRRALQLADPGDLGAALLGALAALLAGAPPYRPRAGRAR